MSNPIGKDDQLVIIVNQRRPFRGGSWQGSLEIDRGREYSYADIMVLASDDPESISMVLKVNAYNDIEDITDKVLDWVKEEWS